VAVQLQAMDMYDGYVWRLDVISMMEKYYGKSDGRKTYRYVRLIEGGRGREREDNKGCPIIFLILLGWRQYASWRRIISIGYGEEWRKEGRKKKQGKEINEKKEFEEITTKKL